MAQQKLVLVVSGVVIEQDDQYLLVQDSVSWVYGKWNLPAGRADSGESPEQAAAREAKEECGFEVKITGHVLTLRVPATEMKGPDKDKYDHAELYAYSAEIVGGELQPHEGEILDAQWFSYEEIKAMQARGELRSPEYVVAAIEKLRAA